MEKEIGIKFDDNTFFINRDEFLSILKEGVKEGIEKANKEKVNNSFKGLIDLIEAINAAKNDNNNSNVVTGSNGEKITLDFNSDSK